MDNDNRKLRILLAEDDPNLGKLLSTFLSSEGMIVKLCADGKAAIEAFELQPYDLCLLDVMMPMVDGFHVAEEIRRTGGNVPFIFITARSLHEDKVKGYGIGADDYITKPFDEQELVLKIRAVLRRTIQSEKPLNAGPIQVGKFVFDASRRALLLDGEERRITERECELLLYLHDNRNRVIRRQELLKKLWGANDYFLGRSLDVFITRIRRLLKEDPSLRIENVYKVGFIFHATGSNH